MLSIHNFELKINALILDQGRKLYERSQVLDEHSFSGGDRWIFEVGGTNGYYQVDLELINQEEIISHSCTCPDDHQSVCKHRVAAFYALQSKTPIKKNNPEEVIKYAMEQGKSQGLEAFLKAVVDKRISLKTTEKKLKPKKTEAELNPSFDPVAVYTKLKYEEQNILKITALAWIPLSINQLKNIYHEVGFDGSSPFYGAKNPLGPIENKGLVQQRGGYIHIKHDFAHQLCETLFEGSKKEFQRILMAIDRIVGSYYWSYDWNNDYIRKMRRARYNADYSAFQKIIAEPMRQLNERAESIVTFWFPPNLDSSVYYDNFEPQMLTDLLVTQIHLTILYLDEPDQHIETLKKNITKLPEAQQSRLQIELATLAFWRGNWAEAEERIQASGHSGEQVLLEANKTTLAANFTEAAKRFQAYTLAYRKTTRKRKAELLGLSGLLHTFALFGLQDRSLVKRIQELVKKQNVEDNPLNCLTEDLMGVLFFLKNQKQEAEDRFLAPEPSYPLRTMMNMVCRFLVDKKWIDENALRYYLTHCKKRGYQWPALEMATILADLHPDDDSYAQQAEELAQSLGIQALALAFPPVEEWENALEQLLRIGQRGKKVVDQEGAVRLAWLVNFDNWTLQAKEQKLGKNGWTKGKNIADKRLATLELSFMTPQDKQISEALLAHSAYGYYADYREQSTLWKALVGHPYLFLEKSPDVAVQFVQEEPLLIARKEGTGYRLSFVPPIQDAGFQIIKETPTRYKLLEPTLQQVEIAQAFNGKSLFIPDIAEDKLQEVIEGLSTMVTVQSSLITDKGDMDAVDADNRICVHLLPVGDGFHLELYVKPFGATPPYFKPAEGEAAVIALINGKRTLAQRDLDVEKKAVQKLIKAVPILKATKATKTGQWVLEDAPACLELLMQLNPLLAHESITLEWPKGEKMRINNVVGFDKFKMSVKSNQDWFEVEGQLQLDTDRVMTMRELIDLSNKSKSQFVEVNPGQFVALTEEFRKRLAKIDGLMTMNKDGSMGLHALAATALDPFTDMLDDFDFDSKFTENRERIKTAFSKKHSTPKNFGATLRPYQLEGFQWLHRLADWGVGACLADDMGLGKTIQALAFLTDRKDEGAALVVAPASVCRNWMKETEKFAPALKPMLFGEGDRKRMVEKARESHLVIVTYDLMTREEALFAEKEWGTIVLDEAQAIKNPGTKRSETAMALQGKFKLAMSGTPLENHLGELWNLMRFLNPGLLGSAEFFNKRFAQPIERGNDDERRDQLKRLVQPFILRRRKDEVLKDLPEKTEITLHVSLSPDERAFYEALRLRAIESIHASSKANQAGQQHLKILAELMKLRRAACHPQLADKNVKFTSSSKLDLFGETVHELIENGHKALVFSQFTGHLAILETYLKAHKISYQYLDGKTPMKKRQERIDAFQAGEGDLFLISLKAGGVGLNLTAADYVIHMDPWWNPAVEDQATDRAHRIGQERPVTVYRLVAEHTIEEKIIKLHEQKRDLADSLLEGTSKSAKMNAEELLALLEEG